MKKVYSDRVMEVLQKAVKRARRLDVVHLEKDLDQLREREVLELLTVEPGRGPETG